MVEPFLSASRARRRRKGISISRIHFLADCVRRRRMNGQISRMFRARFVTAKPGVTPQLARRSPAENGPATGTGRPGCPRTARPAGSVVGPARTAGRRPRAAAAHVQLATRRPGRVAHRLPQHGSLEVDQHRLERRRADDDVVQLGVTMREPAGGQRVQLRQRLLGQPPEPRGRRQRQLLRLGDVVLGRLAAKGREPRVRLPRDQAAANTVAVYPMGGGVPPSCDARRCRSNSTARVPVQPPGEVRLAKVQRDKFRRRDARGGSRRPQ